MNIIWGSYHSNVALCEMVTLKKNLSNIEKNTE
jgi:hypothetical protein